MSASTSNSDRPPSEPPAPSRGPGPVGAVQDMRRRLAVAQHERRQALYDARDAHGDRPTPVIPRPPRLPTLPPARDSLPTLDELTGPEAPRARWRLVLALAAALGGLGSLARELVGFLGKH